MYDFCVDKLVKVKYFSNIQKENVEILIRKELQEFWKIVLVYLVKNSVNVLAHIPITTLHIQDNHFSYLFVKPVKFLISINIIIFFPKTLMLKKSCKYSQNVYIKI